MDPYASSQDIQRCQTCDDGIAELFCVCCDTKLCTRCIGAHIADDPEKHNFVKHIDKYTMLLFPECATHAKEQCKNYCQHSTVTSPSVLLVFQANLTTDTSF